MFPAVYCGVVMLSSVAGGGSGTSATFPLPDVPPGHPAAPAVWLLWRAGVIQGDSDGLFHGSRRLSEPEAVVLSARTAAAVTLDLVLRNGRSLDAFLGRWTPPKPPDTPPYPPAHWAFRSWVYLRHVTPAGEDPLGVWGRPLPTRYEAAVAAATVLREARRYARSPAGLALRRQMDAVAPQQDMRPLDWMPGAEEEEPQGGPGPGPATPRAARGTMSTRPSGPTPQPRLMRVAP